MSLILMTTLFHKALLLQGEIWCWSLLGFKGLRKCLVQTGIKNSDCSFVKRENTSKNVKVA